MPEGPEVKTVARTLQEKLIGQQLGALWHSAYKLRRPVNYQSLKSLEKSVISGVSAYGKVLFIEINNHAAIVVQLGMTGQLKVETTNTPVARHTHVRWSLKNTPYELRYVDPRRFGLFDICDEQMRKQIINKLGPDPFRLNESHILLLINSMRKSSRAIKEVLLDQSVIAGVGNIYASEALFLATINPETHGCDLAPKSVRLLIDAIVQVMAQAYQNCGTSFSNYVDGSGSKGKNLDFLQVFQRHGQPCLICQTTIERIKQGGRSTFYCPRCQAL